MSCFLFIFFQEIFLLLAMPEQEAVIANSVLSGFIEFAVHLLALWLLKRSHPGSDATPEPLEKWNRKMLIAMNNTQGDMIVTISGLEYHPS